MKRFMPLIKKVLRIAGVIAVGAAMVIGVFSLMVAYHLWLLLNQIFN